MRLGVLVAGVPVFRKVVADVIEAGRLDQRTGIKERSGDQLCNTQDAIAGPQPKTSLHPMNSRMPRWFRNLGK